MVDKRHSLQDQHIRPPELARRRQVGNTTVSRIYTIDIDRVIQEDELPL